MVLFGFPFSLCSLLCWSPQSSPFLGLANTTADFSFYCQSCDRTQYGLIYDINFHQMLGTDDISEDAMVACHYHACLRSLSICVTIAIVLMILSFSCGYKGDDLFPVC